MINTYRFTRTIYLIKLILSDTIVLWIRHFKRINSQSSRAVSFHQPRLPNNLFSLAERVVETKVPLGKISFSPNGRTRSALLPLFPDRGRKGEGKLEGSPIRWLNSLYSSLTYKERCNNAGHSIFTMVEGSIACHIKRSQSGASLIYPFPYPPRLSLLDWSITFSSSPLYTLFSFLQSLFLSFSSSFLINCLLLDVNHKNPFLFLFKLQSLVNHSFFLFFDHLINFESYKSFPYSFQLSSFLNRLLLNRINHPFFLSFDQPSLVNRLFFEYAYKLPLFFLSILITRLFFLPFFFFWSYFSFLIVSYQSSVFDPHT